MKLSQLVFVLLAFVLISACSSKKEVVKAVEQKEQPEDQLAVHFIKNSTLTDVIEKAERDGKIVFMDLYTDWCLPCKLMVEDVYSDQDIGDFMNDNFVNYKVNAEKGNGPDLKFLYNIESYPGLLFLDTRGRVLEQKQGAAYHTELKEMANRALDKVKTTY